jgi:hypothetical protein
MELHKICKKHIKYRIKKIARLNYKKKDLNKR